MSYNGKPTRIPSEAYEGFYKKLQNMQRMVNEDLKIKRKIHMADVLRFFSQKRILVYPDELEYYLNNQKRRKKIYPISI